MDTLTAQQASPLPANNVTTSNEERSLPQRQATVSVEDIEALDAAFEALTRKVSEIKTKLGTTPKPRRGSEGGKAVTRLLHRWPNGRLMSRKDWAQIRLEANWLPYWKAGRKRARLASRASNGRFLPA